MIFYFPGLIYAINEISCRAKVRVTEAKNDELMAKQNIDQIKDE